MPPIRIDCSADGYKEKGVWVEFRSDRWPFKDRRRILSSVSDVDTLSIILDYVEDWSMVDIDGKPVPFEREKGMELFDNLDDGQIVSWLIGAWFQAKAERAAIPKVSLPS